MELDLSLRKTVPPRLIQAVNWGEAEYHEIDLYKSGEGRMRKDGTRNDPVLRCRQELWQQSGEVVHVGIFT